MNREKLNFGLNPMSIYDLESYTAILNGNFCNIWQLLHQGWIITFGTWRLITCTQRVSVRSTKSGWRNYKWRVGMHQSVCGREMGETLREQVAPWPIVPMPEYANGCGWHWMGTRQGQKLYLCFIFNVKLLCELQRNQRWYSSMYWMSDILPRMRWASNLV